MAFAKDEGGSVRGGGGSASYSPSVEENRLKNQAAAAKKATPAKSSQKDILKIIHTDPKKNANAAAVQDIRSEQKARQKEQTAAARTAKTNSAYNANEERRLSNQAAAATAQAKQNQQAAAIQTRSAQQARDRSAALNEQKTAKAAQLNRAYNANEDRRFSNQAFQTKADEMQAKARRNQELNKAYNVQEGRKLGVQAAITPAQQAEQSAYLEVQRKKEALAQIQQREKDPFDSAYDPYNTNVQENKYQEDLRVAEQKLAAVRTANSSNSSGATPAAAPRAQLGGTLTNQQQRPAATVGGTHTELGDAATDQAHRLAFTQHTVVRGDTLSKIAKAYGMDYRELARYNNIANPNLIRPNQVIKVPTAPPAGGGMSGLGTNPSASNPINLAGFSKKLDTLP